MFVVCESLSMQVFLTAVIPVFALIACGFAAGKFKWLGHQSTEALSRFVFIFALPALLIRSISSAPVSDVLNINFLLSYCLGMIGVWLLSAILSRLLYKEGLASGAIRAVNSTYGNTGYLGIPLGVAVFGSSAVVPASMTVVVNAFLIIPMAAILIEVSRNQGNGIPRIIFGSVRTLISNPMVISVVIGLILSFSGAQIPEVVDNFLHILGDAAGPCALVAIGLFVSKIPIKGILGSLALISILKLIIFPAFVWVFVTLLFPLEPMWSAMAVIMAGTPLGATAFVVAQRYNVKVSESSASVVATTALSIITLSIMLITLIP